MLAGLLVDSGATTHIINNCARFKTFNNSFNPDCHTIELADGSKSKIAEARGTAHIELSNDNGEQCNATLNNALLMPDYPTNIFSVPEATKNGATVTFGPDESKLITKDGKKFDIVQDGKLFYLETSDVVGAVKEHSLKELHTMMGHCNVHDLRQLERTVDGIRITDPGSEFFCDICARGKQTHEQINKKPDPRATSPLELVHSDLAGPVSPAAKGGFRWAICFVDDYSGFVCHYFLRQKSDTTQATAQFMADVAHIGTVKRLRTDNGGEYISSDFKQLMRDHCVKHEMSAPHTPSQNGTAERSWRTSFDMLRCLLMQADLPKFLWTYALRNSDYVRNRCYQQRTKSTPYELFIGKRPNLSNMVAFGTPCYIYVEDKRKLDDRSIRGVLVGYDQQSPSYLVYDKHAGIVKKSRNVKFDTKYQPVPDEDTLPIVVKVNEAPDVQNVAPNVQNVANMQNVAPNVQNVANRQNVAPNVQNVAPDVHDTDYQEDVRRPKRTTKKPAYLDDYCVDNDNVSLMNIDNIDYCYNVYADRNVPKCYDDAMASSEAHNWQRAMDDEIDSLKENNTWSIIDCPKGEPVVGGKWVFNLKLDKEGEISKYKARYVAQGFSQVYGRDYFETFAPTARLTSIRLLMQFTVQYDLIIHQMDVKTAYLNANIDCNIYLQQPKGFEQGENKVCHLNKSIYGLKQSGKLWNKLIHAFLTDNSFQRSSVDHCLYYKKDTNICIYILIWVDDIVIACRDVEMMNDTKQLLSQRFKMTDMGQLSWFLGIEFVINKDCIMMKQTSYMRTILKKFNMENCKPVSTPFEEMSNDSNSKSISTTLYKCAVGSLIYCMICTRPDLSWVVTKLSQYNQPTENQWKAVKRVLRYLQSTTDLGLTFRKSEKLVLTGYCDASWAPDDDNRRSVTGYCFTLNDTGCAVSWKSKRQQTVALSSTEAEYMGLAAATQEALFLKNLMIELDPMYDCNNPIIIFEDNQSAISLAENQIHHARTKHIDCKYHFIREQVLCKCITVQYLETSKMIADSLTKPVGRVKLNLCNSIQFGV